MKILSLLISGIALTTMPFVLQARIQGTYRTLLANQTQTSNQHQKCPFCKIIQKADPAEIFYQNEELIVIQNNQELLPNEKQGLLIIPKKHIPNLAAITSNDKLLIAELFYIPTFLARQYGYDNFKIHVNNGSLAGEVVHHLYIHFTVF